MNKSTQWVLVAEKWMAATFQGHSGFSLRDNTEVNSQQWKKSSFNKWKVSRRELTIPSVEDELIWGKNMYRILGSDWWQTAGQVLE